MSIRLAAFRLFKNGRLFIRHIHKQQQRNIAYIEALEGGPRAPLQAKGTVEKLGSSGRTSLVQHVTSQARRVFVDTVLNRVTHTLASDLRRRVTRRLLFGDSTPFFALVGVSLASGAGILTKDDELEGVCREIRDAVSVEHRQQTLKSLNEEVPEVGLNSLEFGPLLTKGCNAAIYAVRWRDEMGGSSSQQQPSSSNVPPSILEFPLVVKMMFNYDAESNASAILHAMHRETVPAFCRDADVARVLDIDEGARTKALPQHPNIVEMYRVFTDRVPQLSRSMELYPDALPSRLNPEGSGRNMSLFLVMKRYECSLREMLQRDGPLTPRVSQLLLAQLLEAVAHMSNHGIAHRDLKSDNLLVDLGDDGPCPVLAVTDFGCCLADSRHGLSLPFHSPHTDRGGNAALMPPEVACAKPGPFTSIDYSKSDLWAVGTIAYELFGMPNPFSSGSELRSRNYKHEELPPLTREVPAPLRALISAILMRNPAKRPSPELAATICQVVLWAPSEWLHVASDGEARAPSSSELLQWLLSLATKVLCERGSFAGRGRRTLPEYQLIRCLLARASLPQLRRAVAFVQAHLQN